MYKIGEYQLLDVVKDTPKGFLVKVDEEAPILLPNDNTLGDVEAGDSVMGYIYKDSRNEMIATMQESKVIANQLSALKCVNKTDFGAFFETGLDRDVLMPEKEITHDLEIGQTYLVYCYVDKSDRLCITSRVYSHLTTDHEYKANDQVTGRVIRINPEVGVYVAVDEKYVGMIPKNEYFETYNVGDLVDLRVIRIREDNKIDLATRKLIKDQIVVDSERIYYELVKAGGKLMFHDKSSPEAIKNKFQMSKKAFKRALGKLYKEGQIELFEDYIEKK